MLRLIGGPLVVVVLAALMMLAWAGRAEAVTGIDHCQLLNVSGAYQLTAKITAPILGGDACLLVTADFVTIDLNGFSMEYAGPRTIPQTGPAIASGRKGLIVRNGTIANFEGGIIGDVGAVVDGMTI